MDLDESEIDDDEDMVDVMDVPGTTNKKPTTSPIYDYFTEVDDKRNFRCHACSKTRSVRKFHFVFKFMLNFISF